MCSTWIAKAARKCSVPGSTSSSLLWLYGDQRRERPLTFLRDARLRRLVHRDRKYLVLELLQAHSRAER